jgi:drug/metabolite transporter (DMT)-like permease
VFVYYALIGLTAGTTSLILASVPLLTLLFAAAQGQERLTVQGIGAGIVAIVGIGILSSDTLDLNASPLYFVSALLSAAATAESSVVAKSLPRLDPILTNAVGMTVGAVVLWLVSLGFDERWVLPSNARAWLLLGYLTVAGSVGLFVLFLYVIERWSASATVYSLALMPMVAVTLGALLADEPITWKVILGGAMVLAAVYLGAQSGRRVSAAARPGVG